MNPSECSTASPAPVQENSVLEKQQNKIALSFYLIDFCFLVIFFSLFFLFYFLNRHLELNMHFLIVLQKEELKPLEPPNELIRLLKKDLFIVKKKRNEKRERQKRKR